MKYLPIKTRERSRNPNAKQPRYNLNAAKIVCFFAGGGGGRGGTLNSVTATRARSEARRRFPTYHQQYSSWFTPQKVNRRLYMHGDHSGASIHVQADHFSSFQFISVQFSSVQFISFQFSSVQFSSPSTCPSARESTDLTSENRTKEKKPIFLPRLSGPRLQTL
jgi:hypothetical protein